MSNESQEYQNKNENFLYPIESYHGNFTPGDLVVNANFQECWQQVSYWCSLETNGKISPEETYRQIKEIMLKLNINSSQSSFFRSS
jgi:hypothetical protein